MEETLQALGGILLKAIPTLVLVLLLHFFLKAVFFKPLRETLKRRHELTEGARTAAQASMERAAAKTAEYETALRQARTELYREQEETRRRWLDEQARALNEARTTSQEQVRTAKAQIEADAASARRDLSRDSEALAEQISRLVLEGRAQ